MHSKWLDFATEIAAFHYQSESYAAYKPPAFGSYPDIQLLTRERERKEEMTKQELVDYIEAMDAKNIAAENTPVEEGRISRWTRLSFFNIRAKAKQKSAKKLQQEKQRALVFDEIKSINKKKSPVKMMDRKTRKQSSKGRACYDACTHDERGNTFSPFSHATRARLKAGHLDPDKPPLFLEETAHLLSLISAVAMSTLRNDMEEAESPLIEFVPGKPWPHVDPDAYSADIRKGWSRSARPWKTLIRYLCGVSRTEKSRTLYNAARPFRVIGNVSDAEIELLQAARGPQAKVALCSMWLQEFLSREYMSGSTGKVAPPIISRLYQFISDGMTGYNQARKVAYIPFPFPHAQITTLFVLVIVGFIPVLMLTYLADPVFGFLLNLVTVMCFAGLHEVARELENPFQNVPNDIPLNNFQAQFNEGLMVMFFGYHPDAYWKSQSISINRISNDDLPHPEDAKKEKKEDTAGKHPMPMSRLEPPIRDASPTLLKDFIEQEEETKKETSEKDDTPAVQSRMIEDRNNEESRSELSA